MPFTRLFMGGPDVLERGIRLCAANNIILPFSETELKRLRWTVPFVSFVLCVDALANRPPPASSIRFMCNASFDAWMTSRGYNSVRVGDYVVATKELEMLRSTGKLKVGLFSDIRNVAISLELLTAHVTEFRCTSMLTILEHFSRACSARDIQNQEFERIGLLAHAVGCLVLGHEPDDSSLQQHFIVDVLGEAHKEITAVCETYFPSRS
ncbi:MAG: hypothetical protein HYV95_07305 [Opitutae bacterium]|nr:hypothetical protein [Opitutae bacterium]